MNQTLGRIPFSETLKYTQLAQKMIEQGKDIVRLTAGEPDFNTPEPVIEAAYTAMKKGMTKYTNSSGIEDLRVGISKMLQRYGIHYKPEEIVVSNGGKHALFNTIYTLTNPGDGVAVITPDWVSYLSQIAICGCRGIQIPTLFKEEFYPRPEVISKHITPETKVLIVNSPNNPTGAVYSKELLEEIARIAIDKNLWVISDEVYANLIYDGEHTSISTFPGMRERTVVINAFSKSHAMTGWRCGYSAAPLAVSKEIGKLQSHMTSNINAPTQKAALKALDVDTHEMFDEFKKRRDFICDQLKKIGFSFVYPKGAFYVFMDFNPYMAAFKDDDELAQKIITDFGVAMIPGSAFHAPGFLRMSYASSIEDLRKAAERLERFLRQYRR
ncbi:MAG TPA: pyridoxal phosphate-dependent aminotransferase [Thermotogota bacterium]|jgi:aspartate aminotransferase|nr:pyridoxal phosphate-dependent aminotransferase [Thermotogota bacterium]NLH18722.1 pyridoxal phosphate-dependent aminotransferase [Thermotogaceae bacterium]OQC31354.1 MAG: Aspartate aminotransferase [Thermotogota bacterium ADurb.Bin062]HNW46922.1 pyridoxal phosphate-dependent aminotransferase [Thermotogota bacterium]HNY82658.1 pyridoxal phosphate-dependent aminotransferase [Thermotogota bacterium]